MIISSPVEGFWTHSALSMAVALLVGCSFESEGAGGTAQLDPDGATGTSTTSESEEQSAGVSSDATTSSGTRGGGTIGAETGIETASDPSTSTGPPPSDAALLVIAEAPSFHFGPVSAGNAAAHVFTVENKGGLTATELQGLALAPPFAWEQGAFPGAQGSCGSTLDSGSSCTISVTFAPPTWGPYASDLQLAYHDAMGPAMASCVLGGDGAAMTSNLITNPGCETSGSPPPGWTEVGGDGWTCESHVTPHGGNRFISPGYDPQGSIKTLSQRIDVSAHASLVDAELLRVEFVAWARSSQLGNDEYRVAVRFLNAQQGLIAADATPWATTTSWDLIVRDLTPASGTRWIEVWLECNKEGGGNYCDGYFDDLSLRAVYP